MAAHTRSSLLLLVTVIAVSSLSGASAFDLVRSEGLYGRRLLPESTGNIEPKPQRTFFSKFQAARQLKTDDVYAGFNRGGAAFQFAAPKLTGDEELTTAAAPRTPDTYYSAAQKVKSDNIHAGFNRGGAVRHPANIYAGFNRGGAVRPPAEVPKKVSTDEQTKENEPRAAQTYKSRTSAYHVKTDNAYTGFNQGKAVRPLATTTKGRTDGLNRAGFNRGGAIFHPLAPTAVPSDKQTTAVGPRTADTYYSRTLEAHQTKTYDAYTGFNRGQPVLH